jgi:hypothetical protein
MYRFAPAARQWAAVASIPGVVSSGGLRLFVDTPGVVRGLRVSAVPCGSGAKPTSAAAPTVEARLRERFNKSMHGGTGLFRDWETYKASLSSGAQV